MKKLIVKWLRDGNERHAAKILASCKFEVSTSGGLTTRPDGITRKHSTVRIYAPRSFYDSMDFSMSNEKKEIESALHQCAKGSDLEIMGIHWLPLITEEKVDSSVNMKKETLHMEPSANMDTGVDVVIITALDKELKAVLRQLGDSDQINIKNRTYYKTTIPHEQSSDSYSAVVLSLPGMGNVQAGIATSQAITVWNPSHVILAGITAGIKDKEILWDSKWLGDIIVAEQILGYELAKVKDGNTNRRYQVLRPAFNLIETARHLPSDTWVLSAKTPRPDGSTSRIIPKVHFGVVGSGEKIVADESFTGELKSHWSQLAGIEMESYGTALAAYQADTAPGLLMVKGICDWADRSKNDEWQDYAADISATFVLALLRTAPFPVRERPQAAKRESIVYSGKVKLAISKRIGDDWRDLADSFEIPTYQRKRFSKGYEMQDIWEWLDSRNKLDGLKDALSSIERLDLVEILEDKTD